MPVVGGVPSQDLSSQASAFLAFGSSVSQKSSMAPLSSSHGGPAFVVPSFVPTFASPPASLPLFLASFYVEISSQAGLLLALVAIQVPTLHQLFVVGLGFSPIPTKLVSQMLTGKFVEFNELLSTNIVLTEPEPQLLFDGRLVLTSGPTKPKCCIDDIATWMEAFSTFTLILTSYFLRRWKDLCHYQLLILRAYHQFASRPAKWKRNETSSFIIPTLLGLQLRDVMMSCRNLQRPADLPIPTLGANHGTGVNARPPLHRVGTLIVALAVLGLIVLFPALVGRLSSPRLIPNGGRYLPRQFDRAASQNVTELNFSALGLFRYILLWFWTFFWLVRF